MKNSLNRSFILVILIFLIGCVSHNKSGIPELGQKIIFPENLQLKMEKILSTELTSADKEFIEAQSYLHYAFVELQENHFDAAQNYSLKSLDTKIFSLNVFNFAICIYSLAEANKNPQENFEIIAPTIISRLETLQGWNKLSEIGVAPKTPEKLAALLQNRAYSLPNISYVFLKKAQDKESKPSQQEPPLSSLEQMKRLVKKRDYSDAASIAVKIVNENKNNSNDSSKNICNSDLIYSYYVIGTQARFSQKRDKFFANVSKMVAIFDPNTCSPKSFAMSEREYYDFYIDTHLWMARLLWEKGNNFEAIPYAQTGYLTSKKMNLLDLAMESIQVLVGRIGYEQFSSEENLALLEDLANSFQNAGNSDWIKIKQGLLLYKAQRYKDAAKVFEDIITLNKESSNIPQALFWQWNSLKEISPNTTEEALHSPLLVKLAQNDPLGYYEIAAAEILKKNSRHLSSNTPSYSANIQKVQEEYFSFNPDKEFKIFSQDLSQISANNSALALTNYSQQFRQVILSFVYLYLIHDDYAHITYNTDKLKLPGYFFLKKSLNDLNRINTDLYKKHDNPIPFSKSLAFLQNYFGNYQDSIFTISRYREKTDITDADSFTNLLFYPRPFSNDYVNAANQCNIDIDLLYAISRQESMFQPTVASGAGAIGLMQLLPQTAKSVLSRFKSFAEGQEVDLKNPQINTLAGACYLSELLTRYDGEMAFAIAAYNAGENAVDTWFERRFQDENKFLFIEFIPFAETQKYVQKVLRNYANFKWIYGKNDPIVQGSL